MMILIDITKIIANIKILNSNFNFDVTSQTPPLKSTTNAEKSRIPTHPKKCPTT